jgi:predicted metal-binding membrane protein
MQPHDMRARSLAQALRRDRLVVVLGLVAITVLAWAYILNLATHMQGMGQAMDQAADTAAMGMAAMQSAMSGVQPWTRADFALTFAMWTVMMVAMMTPSAAPMVLIFDRVSRERYRSGQPFLPTGLFLLGYLLVWTAFSLAATFVQWRLHEAAWLSPALAATRPVLIGGLWLAAGIYQLTPLKSRCLARCRTPLGFLLSEWREGARGALVMGMRHGAFCAGCCWLLMALLFVGGVMNVLWVAAIAAYILIEKLAPAGHWLGRALGFVMLAGGVWMLAGQLL